MHGPSFGSDNLDEDFSSGVDGKIYFVTRVPKVSILLNAAESDSFMP